MDDNFISRRTYTRELLTALVSLFRAGRLAPWSAETTLNVAGDDELLDLFRDAGCGTLIIGLESIEEATLQAMDKGVNFCMTFQDAIARVHERGMTVVGNFIVGFDTDRLDVFRRLRDFVQETGILYPFFSILTPMPGTGLFDEYKAAGRLDHEDWHLYDTRHVVMEPRNMTREQLMDGYIWLYEQTYATDALLDRLERGWLRRDRERRPALEKGFLAATLATIGLRADPVMRHLVRGGVPMMLNPRLNTDPGQLLITLDTTDFAVFLRRFRSPSWRENVALFETWGTAHAPDAGRSQWETERAQRGSRRKAG